METSCLSCIAVLEFHILVWVSVFHVYAMLLAMMESYNVPYIHTTKVSGTRVWCLCLSESKEGLTDSEAYGRINHNSVVEFQKWNIASPGVPYRECFIYTAFSVCTHLAHWICHRIILYGGWNDNRRQGAFSPLILKIKFVADIGTHLCRFSIFVRKHRLVLSPNLWWEFVRSKQRAEREYIVHTCTVNNTVQ
jgi:hypothetical protein